MKSSNQFTFQPLTAKTWKVFKKLFGPRGACGGCWCMTWRLSRADYDRLKGDGNRQALHKLVKKEEPIGMIAMFKEEPAGWCAIAPREKYIRLATSRALKPVDDNKVWSVSCFFISRPYRRKGLSVKLLKAALALAKEKGAKMVEAYPVEPKDKNLPDVFAWTGLVSTFERAGFKEVHRHSPSRPIMRYAY